MLGLGKIFLQGPITLQDVEFQHMHAGLLGISQLNKPHNSIKGTAKSKMKSKTYSFASTIAMLSCYLSLIKVRVLQYVYNIGFNLRGLRAAYSCPPNQVSQDLVNPMGQLLEGHLLKDAMLGMVDSSKDTPNLIMGMK